MIISNSDPGGPKSEFANVSHYGDNKTGLSPYNTGTSANCSYCHQNTSTLFNTEMIDPAWNSSIQNHTALATNPGCNNSTCHNTGRIHDPILTKPEVTTTLCASSSCHLAKQKHNNSLECGSCHLQTNRSIHPIQYLQTDNIWKINSPPNKSSAVNCTNCHQNSTFQTGSPAASIIPATLKHSSNTSNGSIWNLSTPTYWTANNDSCYYCHGNTKHNQTALGTINSLLTDTNNTRNGTLSNTKWCADCHVNTSNSNYSGALFLPVPPLITINNTGKDYWINHSAYLSLGFRDNACQACHAINGSSYAATSLNYSHSLDPGTTGPDCISCHDTGKMAQKLINNSAMNGTDTVHRNLNSNATNSSWVSAENKKCWGCHDSTGTQPSNDSMGDRYTNPYKCYDCHNSTSKPYPNVSNAPNVSEHFKGGDQIRAASSASDNSVSCLVCHNLSELKVSYTEDDTYNTNESLASHYGRNRTDLRSWNGSQAVNCSYCHQNSSTVFFTAMADASNSSISNHSTGASSPNCYNSTCHGSGWIHNSTLTRPSFSVPNSTYCITCHTTKERHNGTTGLNCTQCHINSSSSETIHPIKYLQANRSFLTSNTSAVNCTNCHQNSIFWAGSPATPIIPATLKHSSNTSNGSIWNLTTPYWTSNNGSCYYCHGNSKHNQTALGTINSLLNDINNTRNGTLSNTQWCADCHLNISNSNYTAALWSPIPPLITINNTGKNNWVNHSSYLESGYKDINCKSCHDLNGVYTETSLNYSHSLNVGVSGGKDCIGCHDISGGTPKVDVSKINSSTSIHVNLNSNGTATIRSDNKPCWGCHTNSTLSSDNIVNENELPASGHPDGFDTPKRCTNCHIQGNFSARIVSEHNAAGTDIKTKYYSNTNDSCINCHNKSEMIISNSDPGGPINEFANFSHYGDNKTGLSPYNTGTSANCSYCHQNTSTVFNTEMVDPAWNYSIQNHTALATNPGCDNSTCHNTGRIHDPGLTKPEVTTTLCASSSCHLTKQKHNNSLECSSCHLETNRSIHPVQYLQTDNIWKINSAPNKSSAVNCTNCHQNSTFWTGSPSAPIIPATLKHSTNLSNGSIWNISTPFWINQDNSCYYCHTNTKHNTSALGRINSLLADSNNTRNGSLTTTTWCADCHYNTSNSKYNGSLWSPIPPLITIDNTGKGNWVNHSSYLGSGFKDINCISCHDLPGNYLENSLNYSHSLGEGVTGPNCISCHDTSGTAQHRINNSVMNSSSSIHARLNENATATGVSNENKKCWGCHDSTGTQPANGSMGDRYTDPYKCYDCHNSTSKPYPNVSNAFNVSEHFKGGSQIISASNVSDNSSSCLVCHNLSEMKLSFIEDDIYNTNFSIPSHYGRNRTDLRVGASVNCSYCHQNISTAFSVAMQNASVDSMIYNHSDAAVGVDPLCNNNNCHDTGVIHSSTLTKPVLNNTYCLSCHESGAGSAKPIPITHNSSMNCWNCHQDPNGTMSRAPPHGMMYPQENGSYLRYNNGTPANCTSCHVYRLVNTTDQATAIPIFAHSNSASSGTKWGNYWNNSSSIDACYYCHQDTVHNNSSVILGNISIIKGSNIFKTSDLANSQWCATCHYNSSNGSTYKGNLLYPIPPEITNSSLNSSDGTQFFNHSGFGYNDSICFSCHSGVMSGYSEDSLNFTHRVSEGGGGGNCISCHDIGGAGAPLDKRINAQYLKLGVHRNLNGGASNVTAVDPINKACWACHGEGIEPSGHPARYKIPRECSNDDCHALSQLFRAPMVYSHFKDAQLNDNPTDVLNYNVSTRALCEDCHYNSLVLPAEPKSNSSVSHYASKDMLIESVNCIYCHLDEDNAKDWGNATEINKNRTAMIQINRENNKFTAKSGEFIDLGTGYRIKVTGVSQDRGSAAIEIYKLDTLLDSGLIKIGEYVYEENLVIDNATVKTPVIVLNITDMFVSVNGSFIQFNGSRIKRVHPENRTTSCISCHYKGSAEKHKYVVIDRKDEDVYYTEVIFNSSDKELYDQEKLRKLLVTLTPLDKYLDIQKPLRTPLKQGTSWDLGKDYRVTLREVATDGQTALFDLEIGSRTYTDIVRKDEQLEYNLSINYLGNTYTEVRIFKATVKEIAQANPNIVILEDVKALSPEIMSVKDNTTLYGYNTSWFWVDDTFMTGRIPQNLHVPLLDDGKVGGPDCISCHGTKDLGKHTALNVKASSSIASENKACWICHGDGNEPKGHPVNYDKPRVCRSCHADRIEPYYNATYMGDEDHKNVADCSICHVENTHKILKFDMMPGIKEISISKDEVYPGETINLKATAIAGFNMRLKAVEYYIDSPDNKFSMMPVDGSFDGQREDVTADVNTEGLIVGEHMINVRAMERNDKWGPESSISFNIYKTQINISEERENEKRSEGILYVIGVPILLLIIGYSFYIYMMKR
jgi:hypothetical protein